MDFFYPVFHLLLPSWTNGEIRGILEALLFFFKLPLFFTFGHLLVKPHFRSNSGRWRWQIVCITVFLLYSVALHPNSTFTSQLF